jgi:hypothetical protein
VIASIEDQPIIDKILNHLQAKVRLPPMPELLPATRASPNSDWFALRRVSKIRYMVQQHKDRLLGGVLPELS